MRKTKKPGDEVRLDNRAAGMVTYPIMTAKRPFRADETCLQPCISQSQLARRLGVSQRAVSYALNGRAGVNPATRRRILEAVNGSGYRPNSAARSVRTGRFHAVGMLLGMSRACSSLPVALLDGAESSLAAGGMHLIVGRLPDAELTDEGRLPSLLQRWMCDGLLVVYHTRVPDRMVAILEQHRLPVVWINSKHDTNAVRPDDHAAGAEAARRLLEAGHRRIAYVDRGYSAVERAGELHYSRVDRLAGFREAMAAAGASSLVLSVAQDDGSDAFVRMLADLFRARRAPTALVAQCDLDLHLVHEAERLLPPHTSLRRKIVFRSEHVSQPDQLRADSLVVPESEVGRRAVAMLESLIANSDAAMPAEAVPFCFQGQTGGVGPERPSSNTNHAHRERNPRRVAHARTSQEVF